MLQVNFKGQGDSENVLGHKKIGTTQLTLFNPSSKPDDLLCVCVCAHTHPPTLTHTARDQSISQDAKIQNN